MALLETVAQFAFLWYPRHLFGGLLQSPDMYVTCAASRSCMQRSFCSYRPTLPATVHGRSSAETNHFLRNYVEMLSANQCTQTLLPSVHKRAAAMSCNCLTLRLTLYMQKKSAARDPKSCAPPRLEDYPPFIHGLRFTAMPLPVLRQTSEPNRRL